jgi:gliding motility-associated-like protein
VIQAVAGDEYYILINNYGEQLSMFSWKPSSGFTIDFSGSTATFVKGNPPVIDSAELQCANRARAFVDLSKPVKCSSISDAEFTIAPQGTVYSITGVGCNMNGSGFTSRLQLNFTEILAPGEYVITAQNGTDGNTFFDMCDEPLPLPASVPFLVPDLNDTISRTVCPNEIPYSWNNMSLTDTGYNIAHFVSPNFMGCDSNTVLNLFVSDTLRDTVNLRICPLELPYTWNGVTMSDTGMHAGAFYTLAQGGCDSVVSINLFALYPSFQDTTIHSCGVFSQNNQDYYQSQIILDTVQSSLGCDSLYRTIHLEVHPEVIVKTLNLDTAGCGFVLFEDQVYVQSQTLSDTLYSFYGCDSVYRQVHITVYPNTQPVKLWDTVAHCDEVVYEGHIYHSDTTLSRLYTNRAGCDSLIHITRILVDTLNLELTADPAVPVKGDYLTLTTTAKNPYTITAWKPEALFRNQQATEQHLLMPDEAQTFSVYGISDRGCIDSVSLYLKPDSLIPELILPTAFTPNGDGLNDVFRPEFVNQSGHIVKDFKIYNRLGQLVFKQFTSKAAAWDGTIGGKQEPAAMGTYFYYIEVEFVNGKKTKRKGEVTLIR